MADREAPQVTVLLASVLTGYQPQEVFLVTVPYGAFGPPVGIVAVDVSADGQVNVGDLQILVASWGMSR